MNRHARQRVLICLVTTRKVKVATNLKCSVIGLLETLPVEQRSEFDIEFLLVSDELPVAARKEVQAWLDRNESRNVTVICNPDCRGLGADQKTGLRIAIDRGFDWAIVIEYDRCGTSDVIPQLLEEILAGNSDVVLVPRPATQSLTNREQNPVRGTLRQWLTASWFRRAVQNSLTHLQLNDYDSPCRLYRTAFLASVPFESNSNSSLFYTELLLQAAYVGAAIQECESQKRFYPAGIRTTDPSGGVRMLLACIQYRLHEMGMLCSLKLRQLSPGRYQDKSDNLYSSHRLALEQVFARKPDNVLDIGCGPGHVARRCEQAGIEVTGVDQFPPAADSMTRFRRCDLERDPFPEDIWEYDVVLFLDVIEHLASPEEFLVRLRDSETHGADTGQRPLLVLTTPNVAFVTVRCNLLFGRFNYAERGILDITHKRLFNRKTLLSLLDECGYQIERVIPIGPPFEVVLPGALGKCLAFVSQGLARVFPTLFAFQFLVQCRPFLSTRQLLNRSTGERQRHKSSDESLPIHESEAPLRRVDAVAPRH